MNPTKTDVKCVQNHQKGIKEVHTGLFVSCEKSSLLLGVVKRILQQKYSTKAVSGPPQPSGNCEILLQAIHDPPTGVNFPASKDLLENYLNMVKESRPNFVLVKQPEVINVEDEDNLSVVSLDDTMNESSVLIVDDRFDKTISDKGLAKSSHVEVIDIDCCEDNGWFQKSKFCCDKDDKQDEKEADRSAFVESHTESEVSIDENVSVKQNSTRLKHGLGLNDDLEVIDSVGETDSEPMSSENSESSKSRQELNRGGVKRKKSIEIIEIEDDEIIILEDSFKNPKPDEASSCPFKDVDSLTVITKGDNRSVFASSYHNNLVEIKTNSFENSLPCSPKPKRTKADLSKEYFSKVAIADPYSNDSDNTDIQEINATNKNTLANTSKKPSKFSYKRPAHLSSPLTQNVTGGTSESSSGMSNIYNPNASLVEKRTGLRPIVIDGNNVGVSHGKGLFSVKGIQICINYFEKRGHRQIKAFIPQYRRRRDVHDILEKMERQGTVVITPSRRVEGKTVAPYDDRYIVQYAAEVGGVVVTTDNYRDLLEENPTWKETIQKRLLMFSWVDDLLMFPQDPMGRNGPNLDNFLKFPG